MNVNVPVRNKRTLMKPWIILLMFFFPIIPEKPLLAQTIPAWGYHTLIDLQDCNHRLITNGEHIKSYARKLCELIKVKPYGECHVVHFGDKKEIAGYSMFQLIETSNLSAHFVNETNRAYIDIFSCRPYEWIDAVTFTVHHFGGKVSSVRFIKRR